MSRPTLYTLDADLLAIEQHFEESGGAGTDEQIDVYLAAEENRRDKLDGYAALIKEAEARAKARKTEAKRLTDLARSDEALARRLKERLQFSMEQRGEAKIETPRFKLGLRRAGGKAPLVLSVEPEALPEAFRRIAISADTDAIREALAAGEHVPGASLGERSTYLSIR